MLIHIPPKSFRYNQDLVRDFQWVRKRIFLDRMGWGIQVNDYKEVDEFDSEHSHYVVSVHDNEIIGGVRLTPSQAPNLTYETFSKYFGSIPAQRNSQLLEISHFGLEMTHNVTASLLRSKTVDLFVAMLKFAIKYGYKEIITVVDTRMERVLHLSGWEIRRITDVVQIEDTKTIIGILPVSYEIIEILESKRVGQGG
jgi:N-acyl-L-homoserine lactone synthetase